MELFYGNFVSVLRDEGPGSDPSVGKHSAYLGALEQDTEVQSPKTQRKRRDSFRHNPLPFFGSHFSFSGTAFPQSLY